MFNNDEDVIWNLSQAHLCPYQAPGFYYREQIEEWLNKSFTKEKDYTYRSGTFYFKEEKIYVWFRLRWSSESKIHVYRRA